MERVPESLPLEILESSLEWKPMKIGDVFLSLHPHRFRGDGSGVYIGEGKEKKFVPNQPMCPGDMRVIDFRVYPLDAIAECMTEGCGVQITVHE